MISSTRSSGWAVPRSSLIRWSGQFHRFVRIRSNIGGTFPVGPSLARSAFVAVHAPAGERFSAAQTLRQVKRKCAAHAGRAGQTDFAAQQAGDFAADRQPQAGAAVFAARAAVGLLKRFENDLLLLERNADSGIGYRKCQHLLTAVQVSRSPACQPSRAVCTRSEPCRDA